MRSVYRAVFGTDEEWLQQEVFGTYEDAEVHAQFAGSTNRYARFYREVNPRYYEGTSLRFLARVEPSDMLFALAVSAGLAVLRPFRRFQRR